MTQRDELKQNIETIVKQFGKPVFQVISELQAGASAIGDEELLDLLCGVKWDYIEAQS